MGKNTHFTSETIAQIMTPHAVGQQTKEIMDLVGEELVKVKAKGSNDTSTHTNIGLDTTERWVSVLIPLSKEI